MKKFNMVSGVVAICAVFFSMMIPVTSFAAGPAAVNLGTAGNFVILAKTGISTTGSTSVVGDMGVSPIAASAITGFALTLPAASAFSTSALVTGKIYAPSYADPTPANLTTAVSDMQTAYTNGMGVAAGVTELSAGNIGGLTIAPGVYKWGTGVIIPTDVTLSGSANDVWIFQIAQTLTVSSSARIVLAGGAQASNIFWVVAGQTTMGTGAAMSGNILDQTAVVLNTGATLNGRALSQAAVTLDSNAVSSPSQSSGNSSPNPIPNPNPIQNPAPSTSNSIHTFASITSSPAVILNLSALNATEMMISNDPSFAGASWEMYATNKSWTLTNGDGTKVVYAKFRNSAGIVSDVVQATVTVAANGVSADVVNKYPEGCGGANAYNSITGATCANSYVLAKVSYNFGSATLKNGSKGSGVAEVQKFLNNKLNLNLATDGEFGPKTVLGVKNFQSTYGLVADGIVGVNTKAKMNIEAQ